MRVKADLDLCQGHGVCEMEAPGIFRVRARAEDHDQVEILVDEIPDERRAEVEAAVRFCPNRVLSIESESESR
jgi:ferredoxin